jgi:hypothetical protein
LKQDPEITKQLVDILVKDIQTAIPGVELVPRKNKYLIYKDGYSLTTLSMSYEELYGFRNGVLALKRFLNEGSRHG